jgi:hypothetical protein
MALHSDPSSLPIFDVCLFTFGTSNVTVYPNVGVYFRATFMGLLGRTLKHLRGLLENPLRKTDEGIDHEKFNGPEQQHGKQKKSETVFNKIDRFKARLLVSG